MMRQAFAHAIILVAVGAGVATLARPAAAQPSSILVLQTEGRADPGTRAKIDAALIELARAQNAQVSPGEITFADAAAAVGCDPQAPACRDEVLGMLTVDEVVYATVTPKPGGLEIHVRRVTRGGMTREATMTVPAGQAPDTLESVAPLFGGVPPQTASPSPLPSPSPSSSTSLPGPASTELAPTEHVPPPLAGDPTAPVMTTDPAAPFTRPTDITRPRVRRGPVIGMVGGGTMVVIGFMLWGQAGDIRDRIDAAPTNTLPQLQTLAELEARGDSYAGWGNLMFLGGAVLGGVSTYYFLQDRKRARASTARITPTLFDRGAGIALTIGGSP